MKLIGQLNWAETSQQAFLIFSLRGLWPSAPMFLCTAPHTAATSQSLTKNALGRRPLPLKICCKGCVTGSLDTGEPKGEEVLLGTRQTPSYLSKPAVPNGNAVVLATDVFGYNLINARLIADAFAANGFLCAVPDYFPNGKLDQSLLDTAEELPSLSWWQKLLSATKLLSIMASFIGFISKHPVADAVDITADVVQALRKDYGVNKVAVQGYCYGGKVCALMAAQPELVDAVALAHPSMLKVETDVKAMRVPAIFLCAESDGMFPEAARQEAQRILEAKPGFTSRFVLHEGTKHGYAVRGSRSDQVVNQAREDALKQAIGFFQEVFGVKRTAAAESAVL